MSKKNLFSKFVHTYRAGALNEERFGVSMPDGRGGKIRRQGFRTKEQAIEWLEREYERAQVKSNDVELNFVEFCYLVAVTEKVKSSRPATIIKYKEMIRIYFLPFFGATPVGGVDLDLAHKFKKFVEAQEISGTYKRMLFQLFKSVFNEAASRGLITDMRVIAIKAPKKTTQRTKIWTSTERAQFFNCPAVIAGKRYIFWCFNAETGLRAGEFAALLRGDVHVNPNGMNYLSVTKTRCQKTGRISTDGTKTKDTRIVMLSERAMKIIDELPDGSPLEPLFPNVDQKHLARDLQKDCRKAGVPEISFHALRHLYATEIEGQGAPRALTSMLLGHRNQQTTEIYVHRDAERLQELWSKTFAVPANK
jgi:integrase